MAFKAKINGIEVSKKNQIVLEIIKKYVQNHKNITYEGLKQIFPDNLQGSIGVLKNEQDIIQWENDGRMEKRDKRFFSELKDLIILKNDKVYVCNQWGDSKNNPNFQPFIKYAREKLNFNIQITNEEKLQKVGKYINLDNQTKNIILYGSPGVGKTHNINKLIKLIDTKEKSDNEIFEAIKNSDKSDSLDISDISHRVKFITFHQSFGYEDFIEGFRPDEEGNIGLVDGVFKEICKEASKNITKSFDLNKLVFDDALDSLLKDKIENSQTVRIDLNRDNSFFEIYDYNKKSIYYTRQGKSPEEKYHSLSISTLQTMYETESSDIITGGLKTYYRPLLKKLLEVGKQAKVEKTEQQNYYLVIDEINRGNISKIFGELITLIEESKRDKLEVILPYSKQRFKVPSNLYIIGTMNSTDKSIALIDIALRRRFTFLKMEPNADLIEDADAKEIFITLNKYIRDTLGDDYQIGHSYFMGDIDLDFVLEYKIKPLLEEYYYGDSRLSEVVKIIEEI